MKLSRQDPYRRRRSPISIVVILLLLVIVAVFALAWVRGGPQPIQSVEKTIPADQLGK
jgi:hypothetical protein